LVRPAIGLRLIAFVPSDGPRASGSGAQSRARAPGSGSPVPALGPGISVCAPPETKNPPERLAREGPSRRIFRSRLSFKRNRSYAPRARRRSACRRSTVWSDIRIRASWYEPRCARLVASGRLSRRRLGRDQGEVREIVAATATSIIEAIADRIGAARSLSPGAGTSTTISTCAR
jgi:hypothetical protein